MKPIFQAPYFLQKSIEILCFHCGWLSKIPTSPPSSFTSSVTWSKVISKEWWLPLSSCSAEGAGNRCSTGRGSSPPFSRIKSPCGVRIDPPCSGDFHREHQIWRMFTRSKTHVEALPRGVARIGDDVPTFKRMFSCVVHCHVCVCAQWRIDGHVYDVPPAEVHISDLQTFLFHSSTADKSVSSSSSWAKPRSPPSASQNSQSTSSGAARTGPAPCNGTCILKVVNLRPSWNLMQPCWFTSICKAKKRFSALLVAGSLSAGIRSNLIGVAPLKNLNWADRTWFAVDPSHFSGRKMKIKKEKQMKPPSTSNCRYKMIAEDVPYWLVLFPPVYPHVWRLTP